MTSNLCEIHMQNLFKKGVVLHCFDFKQKAYNTSFYQVCDCKGYSSLCLNNKESKFLPINPSHSSRSFTLKFIIFN